MKDVPALAGNLQVITQHLHELWAARSLPEEGLFPFELALEEVFMNVVMHGSSGSGEASVALDLTVSGDSVTLAIEDDGAPFDPLSAPAVDVEAPLEDRDIGGLGLHLIREMMDAVRYEYRDGHNCLLLTRSAGASAPDTSA